jgi:hypothetical protein
MSPAGWPLPSTLLASRVPQVADIVHRLIGAAHGERSSPGPGNGVPHGKITSNVPAPGFALRHTPKLRENTSRSA